MKEKPYQRQPGDFEVRILKDGRVVMIAPDNDLMEIAQILDPRNIGKTESTENQKNARTQNTSDS